MFTSGGVQACIGNAQSLDRLFTKDVGYDDFFDISRGYISVPNRIRIDDYCRTVLTLVETTGLVGAHSTM